jgi:hypothetical protein
MKINVDNNVYRYYIKEQIEKGNTNWFLIGSFHGTPLYDHYKNKYDLYLRKEKIKQLKNENSTNN